MDEEIKSNFSFPQFLINNKIAVFLIGLGIFFLLVGARLYYYWASESKVSFIQTTSESASSSSSMSSPFIKIDLSGAVTRPGVYTLNLESRVSDALEQAGGLLDQADHDWVAKNINLAQKLSDGTKIYIPLKNENTVSQENIEGAVINNLSNNIININTASKADLDQLPGIGLVTADKIISNRPYETIEDLLTKKIVNKSTFEKIKDKVSLY